MKLIPAIALLLIGIVIGGAVVKFAPVASPTSTPMPPGKWVCISPARLHSAPNESSPIVATMNGGYLAFAQGNQVVDESGQWLLVNFIGKPAWVNRSSLCDRAP